MMEVLKGLVVFFGSKGNKNYGVIQLEDGRKILFCPEDYRPLGLRKDGGVFFGFGGTTAPTPAIGDPIVFVLTEGRNGSEAMPWAYAAEHEAFSERET